MPSSSSEAAALSGVVEAGLTLADDDAKDALSAFVADGGLQVQFPPLFGCVLSRGRERA